jgi:hypothetical protein
MVIPEKLRDWGRKNRIISSLIAKRAGVLPYYQKHEVIKDYATKFGARLFVETGTYKGDTLFSLQNYFDKLYSIELDQKLYEKAKERFADSRKIEIIQGDSSKILPVLLSEINEKTIFWLDAHYSRGVTACGEKETPVREELEAIANHRIKDHVILIDDARSFGRSDDYPNLEEIQAFCTWTFKNHKFEVKDDIIRIFSSAL